MNDFTAITKALSDGGRARAVMALGAGELCLCQIIEVLGLSPSTVSKHMAVLQQAGLVRRRKDGRWHYYRLAGDDAPPMVREAIRWTLGSLEDDRTVVSDAKVLRAIRRRDREELTACYGS